jgi:hypothetical protein
LFHRALPGLLVALSTSGLTATVIAQVPSPSQAAKQHEAKGGMHMGGTMDAPHHVLAMAYRDNLATFARSLRGAVAKSKNVNLELARPAVAEMRRSFDQMQQHHRAQMGMMPSGMSASMSGMMSHMSSHVTALTEHLAGLESEVGKAVPAPAAVVDHANEILKHCAGMSQSPGTHPDHAMPAKSRTPPKPS